MITTPKPSKKERLAKALKANLQRRKQKEKEKKDLAPQFQLTSDARFDEIDQGACSSVG